MARLKLPLPLRDANPRLVDAAWHEIRARRSGERSVRWTPALAYAACAVVALVVATALFRRPSDTQAASTFDVGVANLAAEKAPLRRNFIDGSWIELAPGGVAVWSVDDAKFARIRLDRGKLVVHVEPNGPRTWAIEAGPTTVTVIGTDFAVEREPTSTAVSVDHGIVAVRGPGVVERRLLAGERLTISDAVATTRDGVADPGTADSDTVSIDSLPAAAERDIGEPAHRDAGSASWRYLSPREAFAALGDAGFAREVARATDGKTLLELADIARLGGRPALAVGPLSRILRRSPADPDAAVAAFTLGKLELDELGHPDRASQAFAECIRLGPPRGLAEDARSRNVEALAQAGDEAGARRAAREYRRLYPDGRHLAKLAPWLGD